jgi:hypothetical protein
MGPVTFVCNPNSAAYYWLGPASAFESQGARVVWSDVWDYPPGVVLVADEPVAYFTIHDFGVTALDVGIMGRYPVPLLLHLCPTLGVHGQQYAPIAKVAGYYAPLYVTHPQGVSAAWAKRTVRVTARMRTHQDRPDRAVRAWSLERAAIVNAAGVRGFAVGKVAPQQYAAELLQAKVGLNWRGICPMNFRVIEYLRNGVCMVSDRLDFDVREGVRLVDGVHYVAADSGADAVERASALLEDDDRARRIGEAGRALWEEYLTPERLGAWYMEQVREVSE